jgi:SAM-dependent methyltransferase
MRDYPAGDVDYDEDPTGQRYAAIRRSDPRIADAIRASLGAAKSLINVGAGTGSYEPVDMEVVAVEPSASMRDARPAELNRAIDAVASQLPFADDSFDAAMATFTVHQWPDLEAGLCEMRRVARGPVVILTADPEVLAKFWLRDYAPSMMANEAGRMPPIDRIALALGGRVTVTPVPIPRDCADGFAEAFFGRPERLLRADVRSAQSAWRFLTPREEQRCVAKLEDALEDGTWDLRHGHLRELDAYDGSLRLVIAQRA